MAEESSALMTLFAIPHRTADLVGCHRRRLCMPYEDFMEHNG